MASPEVRDWVGQAQACSALATPCDTPATVGGRLVTLDKLMRAAPPFLLNAYSRIAEDALVHEMELRLGVLNSQDDWSFSIDLIPDPVEIIFPLALEIRAMDAHLRREREGPPDDPNSEWLVPDGSAFVIPCHERRTNRRDGSRERQPYERRGLLKHRILPSKIGDFTIHLNGGGARHAERSFVGPSFRGGAGLFTGLNFKERREGQLFTLEECRAKDHEDQIVHSLKASIQQNCAALVFPELTMGQADREFVGDWLAERLQATDEFAQQNALKIVVAGSCHETVGDKTVNRGAVFDGGGRQLAIFDKLLAYHSTGFGSEAIEEARVVEVLVLEQTLIGFGICRDFAEIKPINPFQHLDVDMMIVPSMGNERTARGHSLVAKLMDERFTTRTFVVQQHDDFTKEPLGFVVNDCEEKQQNQRFQSYQSSTERDLIAKSWSEAL